MPNASCKCRRWDLCPLATCSAVTTPQFLQVLPCIVDEPHRRERERACSCFMFHKKQFVPHQCCTLVSPPVQVKACQILAGQKCRRTPSRKRWIQEGAVGFNVNELKLQSLPTWILHAVQANVSTWLSCVIAAFRPQACVQDLTRKKAAAVTRNRRRLVQSFLEFEAETQSRCCNLLAQYGLFE